MKQRAFSGIQPTGGVHIGNYIGAISQWVRDQTEFDCCFCVVDLHALTVPEAIESRMLQRRIRETAALVIACGIDPEKSTLFVQSQVPEHASLGWILTCVVPLGWLNRMVQFKSKAKAQESVGAGLLVYPALQAADILLHRADVVPVGEDQVQHIELARDIALRFNKMFGETFVLPKALVRENGARIMGLDDPSEKMSKSLGSVRANHLVQLLDSPERIRAVILRARTDGGQAVDAESPSPGIRNLLTIYEAMVGEDEKAVQAFFQGKSYGFLKRNVADAVVAKLAPIQARYRELMDDPAALDTLLASGAARAREDASDMIGKVSDAVGVSGRSRR